MQRQVIKEYIMRVYEDGSISLEPIQLSTTEDGTVQDSAIPELTGCSSRIAQVLNIIIEVANDKENTSFDKKISEAINKTVHKYGLNQTTVIDKCTRQLSLLMEDFKRLVRSSIEEGDDTLEKLLIAKVGAYTKKTDEQAIKQTFNYIRSKKQGKNDCNSKRG